VWGRLLAGGLSVVAWSIEESISPPLPAGIAKALLFLDCGMVWNSARLLHGRQIVWAGMIFGAAVWLVAGTFSGFRPLDHRPGHSGLHDRCGLHTCSGSMMVQEHEFHAARWSTASGIGFRSATYVSCICVFRQWINARTKSASVALTSAGRGRERARNARRTRSPAGRLLPRRKLTRRTAMSQSTDWTGSRRWRVCCGASIEYGSRRFPSIRKMRWRRGSCPERRSIPVCKSRIALTG
jgi:hypothetical protein